MTPPFRIAFLGIDHPHAAGWRKVLTNLGDDVEINAIVPGFGGATASLEERLSGAARFDTVEELIGWGEFDGAIVCLPNNENPDAICLLARAGKHIMTEKPAAGCGADALRIAEAVRSAGVSFQSGYTWRYDEGVARLKRMMEDDRFGKLISVEMTYFTSDVARRGPTHYLFDQEISSGGFFNWLACHWLDTLLYITGQAIVGVTSRVGVFGETPSGVEDGGAAILDLSGGGIATLIGGYWIPRWAGEGDWNFRGAKRWVHWDPRQGVIEIHGPQPQWDAMEERFELPEDNTPGYGGARAVAALKDWVACARAGGGDCRNTPESTVATLQVIDAIYQASQEGQRIACEIGPA